MDDLITGNNVSHKYKIQWIAPERTGSRKLAEILSFFGFENNGKKVFDYGKFNYVHHHDPTKYTDYKIICSVRNPYSKVLSLFKNFYEGYSDKTKENFKKYLIEDLPRG